jgi:adenine phosphoribosyltransferase
MAQTLTQERLKEFVRDVPDFPKKGIMFKDITPLLKNAHALESAISLLAQPLEHGGVDFVAGVESRGFILGAAVAIRLKAGFIPVRKKGKLPWQTERMTYELEYGEDVLEIHRDALSPGNAVLVVDDLLATGGTARAVGRLVEKLGGRVLGFSFLIELAFLRGRDKLAGHPVHSLIQY